MDRSIYPLNLVTDLGQKSIPDYLNFIEHCVQGGVSSVQLREKNLSPTALLDFGSKLLNLLKSYKCPLIVNDSLDLTLALDADGVHLGQNDGNPVKAREALGINKWIGLSINSEEELIQANKLPVNYLGVGFIFPSNSKSNIQTIWGTQGLRSLVSLSKHPILAIGGIDLSNAQSVIDIGVDGIAAITAFHEAPNPKEAAAKMKSLFSIPA